MEPPFSEKLEFSIIIYVLQFANDRFIHERFPIDSSGNYSFAVDKVRST